MVADHHMAGVEIRCASLEAAILSLLRQYRYDSEGFEVPGQIDMTIQASALADGGTTIDLAVTLNERPLLGVSL